MPLDHRRNSLAACYIRAGLPVPRHILPDLEWNGWRRYELEKEFFPPGISPEGYDRSIANIAEGEMKPWR